MIPFPRRVIRLLIAPSLISLLAACFLTSSSLASALPAFAFAPTPTAPAAPDAYWPYQEWRTSTPEEQGIDSARLVQMFDYVQAHHYDLHSLLIVRHGYLVTEAYYPPFQADTFHDIQSGAKSVISALVGIALDQGYLEGVNQPMLGFFPDRVIAPDVWKQDVTLEDLLTMTAGLDWDEWRPTDPQSTLYQLSASPDKIQFVLDRRMSDAPGARWNYNSGLPLLLGSIIQQVSGTGLRNFAQNALFSPLGIHALIQTDAPSAAMNVALTPQDMAKFGYLYLRHGQWAGQSVISPVWVQASTSVHTTTPYGANYGYFWWLPPYGGYEAEGDGGQRIIVLPDQDMVVVITGGLTYPDMQTVPDQLVQNYILPAAKSAEPLRDNYPANVHLASRLQAITQLDPRPVLPLPPIAGQISGQTYALQPNSIGLQAVALTFSAQDASLRLTFAGRSQDMQIGLDNTDRITPLQPLGPLYGWIGLRGKWQSTDTFGLHLLMTGVVRNLEFQFQGDSITVRLLGSRGEREAIPGTAVPS